MGKKMSLPLAAIALLAALFGFTGTASAAGESISGTLTDSAGDPVEDYCVSATRYGTGGSLVLLPVRTAADGTYTITQGVTPAEYTLRFDLCGNGTSVPSNENLIPEYWDDKPDLSSADRFTVGDGEVVTGKNAVLQIGAQISGTISGPGGPIEGCVSLYGPGVAAGIQTAPNGQYEYSKLRAGDYQMIFDDCGDDGLSFEWFEDSPTRSSADTITLTAAEERTVDATLAPGGAISGTVTDTAGAALEHICVRLYDADDRQFETRRTNAAGQFTVGGLPAGSYRVFYADCDYRNNVAAEYYDDASTLATADPVVVTGTGTTTADAELGVGGSISGVVRGPDQLPFAGGCVSVYNAAGDGIASVDTAADGSYRLGSLATGNYRVEFRTCGSLPDPDADDIEEFWKDKATLLDADPIAVTTGVERSGTNATLGAPDPVAPNTTIVSGPASGSTQTVRTASFAFSSTIGGSSFECRLDAGAWQACTSPRPLSGLSDGSHTFQVRATSPALLVDASPASRTFTVAAGPCEQARSRLATAEAGLPAATQRVERAQSKLEKARESGKAKKIKKAKRKLKQAKRRKRVVVQSIATAQAEVARLC